MISKKRILVFVGYYLPGYKAGGPIRTIANMVEMLSDDFEFYIVTSDRDSVDTEPYSSLINKSGWQEVGKARVLYLSPKERGIVNIAKIIRETPHDFLYLNSFFSFGFTVKPLLLRRFRLIPDQKLVLAPRGEFSKGALGLKSLKKRIFLMCAFMLGLYKNIKWQASSKYELDDIRQTMGAVVKEIHEAIDLPDTSNLTKSGFFMLRNDGEPLRLVFLSRISPMKNLHYALELLKSVKADIIFDVIGSSNDSAYYQKCFEISEELPANVKVNFKGAVDHEQVVTILSRYDVFFLPTKGENFGHVILEALSAGTPALIANTTPWMDLEENNAGWAFSLDDSDRFIETIELMAALSVEEQQAQREAVRAYAKKHLFNKENIEQNKLLFS